MNLASVALLLSVFVTRCLAQPGCQTPYATSGLSQRWATANPALVAPVTFQYNYPPISDPLISELIAGTATQAGVLAITLPASYKGGFYLENSPGNESYVLRRIEYRKAGQTSAGVAQVLFHTLEATLIHEQVGGSYWAELVVPFMVSGSSAFDASYALFQGAVLPTRPGQQMPVLLSSAFDLNVGAFIGTNTLLHYWTIKPSTCGTATVNARHFLLSVAANMGIQTYQWLLVSLDKVPQYAVVPEAKIAWLVNTCSSSGCTGVASTPLSSLLAEAQALQTQALDEFRSRRALMDQAYNNLIGSPSATGTTLSTLIQTAVSAKSDLINANSELESIVTYTMQLQTWSDQTQGANWDGQNPAQGQTLGAIAQQALQPSATAPIAPVAPITALGTTLPPKLVALSFRQQVFAAAEGECASQKLSPIDIDTKRAIDPGTISPTLREPLQLLHGSVDGCMYSIAPVTSDSTSRLRVSTSGCSANNSPGHLGSVMFDGLERRISYIDIVAPGGHAVDGKAGVVELQLVHQPPEGPVVAVSVPLDLSQAAEAENAWLQGVLKSAVKGRSTVLPSPMPSLELLHDAFAGGSVERYFRYDGSLTAPPCSDAAWFVMDRLGHISSSQLTQLRELLSISTSVVQPQRFRASLVALGTPRLVTGQHTAAYQGSSHQKSSMLKARRIAI